jgi:hypothetical protein
MMSDILIYLLGAGFGAIVSLIKMSMEQSQQRQLAYTKEYIEYIKSVDKRTYYQIAKIIIAFMIVSYFTIFPVLCSWLGWTQYISFDESNGFFTSLISGSSDTHWHQFNGGAVFSPVMTFALGQVMTSFFINSKHAG